ncbi:hypothetical protein FRC10_009706 [Ceratobasidium sp. 414]|nr:hypothetical protein FRC10_009706 [Ceratobasidium sp. 414]
MAPQPTTKGKQRLRRRVQEIKLEPDKSSYDIAIELQVDGTRIHKLAPIKKGQLLHWSGLCLPCDVREDSAITLQVTEVHTLKDRVDRAETAIETWVEGCENGMFRIQVTFLDEQSAKQVYLEAFSKVQRMEKQPGLIEKAGRVGHAFKALLAVGGMMVDVRTKYTL